MKSQQRAVQIRITQYHSYWIAEGIDLALVTQAPSLDALVVNIREAVELHLDGEDLESFGLPPRQRIHATIELKLWAKRG
ncbi:MAG: type II toxin-antitoxin system HicB family antitoxin [Bryobacteraceae bacterium]|nr:type II toxin-antitoxin system HicB family antitoxin [Bryobacteraceae bacterium]